MGEFTLEIREGEFTDSEIVVMLGENGAFARADNKTNRRAERLH